MVSKEGTLTLLVRLGSEWRSAVQWPSESMLTDSLVKVVESVWHKNVVRHGGGSPYSYMRKSLSRVHTQTSGTDIDRQDQVAVLDRGGCSDWKC